MRRRRIDFALSATVLLAGSLPAVGLAIGAALGRLGANPVETVTHVTGEWTLRFLLLTLAVSPLRRWTGWHRIISQRRTLGLFAFFYATLHLGTWLTLEHFFDWEAIAEDVLERPFVTAGSAAFLLMVPLAITSTRGWIRRLGSRWARLHRLVYASAVLGVVHFAWGVKADLTGPLVHGAILALLLGERWLRRSMRSAAA